MFLKLNYLLRKYFQFDRAETLATNLKNVKLDNIAKQNFNDLQFIKIYVRCDHDLLTIIKCNIIKYQL